jgi:hypothetical protein
MTKLHNAHLIDYYRAYYRRNGLLQYDNAKTSKGEKLGYRTGILYLMPFTSSGFGNLCPMAGGCAKVCLVDSGMGEKFKSVNRARQRKTEWFFLDREGFLAQLRRDLAKLRRYCAKTGHTPAVRPNGTSDFPWESTGLLEEFPDVTFYDYTKIPKRMHAFLSGVNWPANYHLVFSRDERNEAQALAFLAVGGIVSAVFRGSMPQSYQGFPVLDGTLHDLTFTQPRGHILGLCPKGRKAKKDTSGFIIDLA